MDVFQSTLAERLEHVYLSESYRGHEAFKAFTECLGPNSFAGLHKEGDVKRLVLFDVESDGFGLVGPERFVADFGRQDQNAGLHGAAEGGVRGTLEEFWE